MINDNGRNAITYHFTKGRRHIQSRLFFLPDLDHPESCCVLGPLNNIPDTQRRFGGSGKRYLVQNSFTTTSRTFQDHLQTNDYLGESSPFSSSSFYSSFLFLIFITSLTILRDIELCRLLGSLVSSRGWKNDLTRKICL